MDCFNPGSWSTLKRLAALEQLIDFDSIADKDREELHAKDIHDPVASALQKQNISKEPMVISSTYWKNRQAYIYHSPGTRNYYSFPMGGMCRTPRP